MSKQKATAIVLYSHGNHGQLKLHNLSVVTRNNHLIQLIDNPTDDCFYFDTMHELYTHILAWLKNNSFEVNYYFQFNTKWYDIQWIDTDDRTIHRYGYKNI